MSNDVMLRHLLDLCRRNERTGLWQYSAFLSPAEQDDLLRSPEASGYSFLLTGGYEGAERRILAAGSEAESGPPEVPLSVIAVRPKSDKYAEDLTHRDFLGSALGLGLERSLIGDILIRGKSAWIICLSAAADLLVSSLTQVRRTAVRAVLTAADIPELNRQLPASRRRGVARVRHIAALPRHGADIALLLKFPIGPLDRVGVDSQLRGQLSHGGQALLRPEHLREDQFPEPVLHLLIDRSGIAIVDLDQENHLS